jgi:TPR repeat protein
LGGTVIGQAAPNGIGGTVMGPAAGVPLNGTVIGQASGYNNSANPYQSGNPYTSGNPYQSGNPYGPQQGGSKKGLWIGIAIAAILAIGAGAYFLFGSGSSAQEQTEVAIDPAQQEQAEYEAALAQFNQESPDSIQMAFNRMKVLADNGNKDAIFEVAKTYAWIPNDSESDRRKRLLGWSIIEKEDSPLKGAPASEDINREAISWLQKSIDQQVPNFHQSLYWLAFYYFYGIGTNEDFAKAKQMLEQAKIEAEKNQDFVFKGKIEKTLEQLD